ncbi:hypothetical protein MPS_5578 [Mycobacterium pseudoshottsii JCM 15466]|nr:hypothetical protein MPS_5578 [Mycobacterium pseudoshottsii JCM 15466]
MWFFSTGESPLASPAEPEPGAAEHGLLCRRVGADDRSRLETTIV